MITDLEFPPIRDEARPTIAAAARSMDLSGKAATRPGPRGAPVSYLSWQTVALALDALYEKTGAAWHTEITDAEGRAASRESLACAPLAAASAANAPPLEIAERVAFRRAGGQFGIAPESAQAALPGREAPTPPGKCEDCGAPVRPPYRRCWKCNQAARSNAA